MYCSSHLTTVSTLRHLVASAADRLRTATTVAGLLAVSAVAASAQIPVTAAWDANSDGMTRGYEISVGTSPGNPLRVIDVGLATSTVLPLPPGAVYYVSVQAYNEHHMVGPATPEAVVDLANTPGAPDGVRTNVNGTAVTLRWNAPTSGGVAQRYLVSVGTAPGAANLISETNVGNVLSAAGNVAPGTYYARIHAANLVGIGPASADVSFQVGGAPDAPTALSASWTGGAVRLAWSPGSGVSSYVLEVGRTPGATDYGSFNVGAATAYSATVPAGTFYVRVRGVNSLGMSAPSNEVMLAGQGAQAPSAPRVLSQSGAGSTVNLWWDVPTTGTADSYVIEAGTAPGLSNIATLALGRVTSFATSAPPGTYYVRVRARNGAGLSAPSNEIVVRR